MRIRNSERLLFAVALLAEVAICPCAASALSIEGPDEISIGSGNSTTYTVEGASGNVQWSVTGNFGVGGGISNAGVLTALTNACGVLSITAYVDGTVLPPREVRVQGGGIWSSWETTCTAISGTSYPDCWQCGGTGSGSCGTTLGKYEYHAGGQALHGEQSGCPASEGCDAPCSLDLSTANCGEGGIPLAHVTLVQRRQWLCPTCTQYINDDGDGFYSIGSCGTPATDCNDNDKYIYPGAPEVCGDGKDNNCDGVVDEGCKPRPACAGIVAENGACLPPSPARDKNDSPTGGCRVAGLDMFEPVESPLAAEFIRGGSASASPVEKGVTARAETVSGKVMDFLKRLFEWRGN